MCLTPKPGLLACSGLGSMGLPERRPHLNGQESRSAHKEQRG